MENLQKALWFILAAIHAIPAFALFRPSSLSQLYNVPPDSGLFLLLQHRAALFLTIFILCIWAAFAPATRRLASLLVGISMISFLALYVSAGAPEPLRLIATVDLIGTPVLVIAAYFAVARPL